MKRLNDSFQNCNIFQNRLNRYREIVTRTWPKMNTFMRFAADRKYPGDVISGGNVKTLQGHAVLKFLKLLALVIWLTLTFSPRNRYHCSLQERRRRQAFLRNTWCPCFPTAERGRRSDARHPGENTSCGRTRGPRRAYRLLWRHLRIRIAETRPASNHQPPDSTTVSPSLSGAVSAGGHRGTFTSRHWQILLVETTWK